MYTANEKLSTANITDIMQTAYIDYSMSVIISRALPDARDGLKPVQRRILFSMDEIGARAGRPYVKSATVIGQVIGHYHPHGDTAVYDAMVRLAQDFSLNVPLVDGQGNFGSVGPKEHSDPPAAYRYTEARLTQAAVIISPKLCGGMLVVMPTAMPVEPFISRFGSADGSTVGSVVDSL